MNPPNEPARPDRSEHNAAETSAPDQSSRSGARFPSAKALERIEKAERKAAQKAAAKEAKQQGRAGSADGDSAGSQKKSRTGRGSARFPSAADLERYADEPIPEPPSEPTPEPGARAGSAEPEQPTRRALEEPARSTVPPSLEDHEDYADYTAYDADEENRLRVRPYVITRGRTEARDDLAIETMITVNPRGPWSREQGNSDHQAVRRICGEPRSVAEVAALMSVPLGVARVLLTDLADSDLVHIHVDTTQTDDGRPDFNLMQRVLAGLHRLS